MASGRPSRRSRSTYNWTYDQYMSCVVQVCLGVQQKFSSTNPLHFGYSLTSPRPRTSSPFCQCSISQLSQRHRNFVSHPNGTCPKLRKQDGDFSWGNRWYTQGESWPTTVMLQLRTTTRVAWKVVATAQSGDTQGVGKGPRLFLLELPVNLSLKRPGLLLTGLLLKVAILSKKNPNSSKESQNVIIKKNLQKINATIQKEKLQKKKEKSNPKNQKKTNLKENPKK